MALKGEAFLAIWRDIDPPQQEEYMEWHTREHMPERISTPGFSLGKRLINQDLNAYQYGTIYCGDRLDVFRSSAYLKRLNNPTQWTLRVQPAFRNFLRIACERLASSGFGEGGAAATVRLNFSNGADEARLRAAAKPMTDALLKIKGACCTHVGLAHLEVTNVKTRETELRPEMNEKTFDALVIVEGSGRPELEAVVSGIENAVTSAECNIGSPVTLVHDLAYHLSDSDMVPEREAK
jgi:hypothetical protein